MGVPTSEVGYTPAMPRREDHEVHKGHVVAMGKKKNNFVGWFSEVWAEPLKYPIGEALYQMQEIQLTWNFLYIIYLNINDFELEALFRCYAEYRSQLGNTLLQFL